MEGSTTTQHHVTPHLVDKIKHKVTHCTMTYNKYDACNKYNKYDIYMIHIINIINMIHMVRYKTAHLVDVIEHQVAQHTPHDSAQRPLSTQLHHLQGQQAAGVEEEGWR